MRVPKIVETFDPDMPETAVLARLTCWHTEAGARRDSAILVEDAAKRRADCLLGSGLEAVLNMLARRDHGCLH